MTPEQYTTIRKTIRKKMRECGVWNAATNLRIYTTDEFIAELGDMMPDDLKNLLRENVGRLQCYLDERILEPLNPDTRRENRG